jgi:hypothetical protein
LELCERVCRSRKAAGSPISNRIGRTFAKLKAYRPQSAPRIFDALSDALARSLPFPFPNLAYRKAIYLKQIGTRGPYNFIYFQLLAVCVNV